MTYTDEQVERVARALARKARVSEMEANGFNGIHLNEYVDACWADHKDRARAAIAALQPHDGWQDIATAPKDGTLCLFFAPGRNKAKYIERAKRQMTVVDAFSPQWVNGKYQLPENPYTHWRPLPAPPAAEIERTKG